MKLPLLTRKIKNGESLPGLFHVLQFDGNDAIGVNEDSLRIEREKFSELEVLSDEEYFAHKEKIKKIKEA